MKVPLLGLPLADKSVNGVVRVRNAPAEQPTSKKRLKKTRTMPRPLGEAYALLAGNTIAAPQDSVPKAKEAANRALALDPGMGEAHATLGHVAFFYDCDFNESEKEFRRGIELSPNYAIAHQWYGILLITEKRFDEAEPNSRPLWTLILFR